MYWYAQIDFIILKQDPTSDPEIDKVYLSRTDVKSFVEAVPIVESPSGEQKAARFVKLLDLVLEDPRSKLVQNVFAGFVAGLEAQRTVEVSGRLSAPRCIRLEVEKLEAGGAAHAGHEDRGQGDGIDIAEEENDLLDGALPVTWDGLEEDGEEQQQGLNVEDEESDEDADETLDGENEEPAAKRRTLRRKRTAARTGEPSVNVRVKYRRSKPIADERRFFDRCEELGKEAVGDAHYQYDYDAGMTCLHCGKIFTSKIVQNAQRRINLLRVVVDHILVVHFGTWAYRCGGGCGDTFDSVEPYHKHCREGCGHKQHR